MADVSSMASLPPPKQDVVYEPMTLPAVELTRRWEPRASTPNGPHPMTSPQRQPTPLPLEAEAEQSQDVDPLPDFGHEQQQQQQSPDSLQQHRPTTPPLADQAPVKPPMSAWRNMPGFEELDQSWAEASQDVPVDQGLASSRLASSIVDSSRRQREPLKEMPPNQETTRIASDATEAMFFDAKTSVIGSSSQQPATAGPSRAPEMPQRRTWNDGKAGLRNSHLQPHARPNIPSLTDSELVLQPGPSKTGMRQRSQDVKTSIQEGSSSAPEEIEQGGEMDRPSQRHLAGSASSSRSSSSDRKQGSLNEAQQPQQQEEVPAEDSTDSMSLAGVTASEGAAGVTFIVNSGASDLPPVLRPAWQKGVEGAVDPRTPGKKKSLAAMGGDMFTPLKLQTMFKTPTPPPNQPEKEAPQVSEAPNSPSEDVRSGNLPVAAPSQVVSNAEAGPSRPRTPSPPRLKTVEAPRSGAFTFRSPLAGPTDSPFAHLATPRSAAKKRGLSAEAYAHIGRTPSGSAAGLTTLRKQKSLPLRLFCFQPLESAVRPSAEQAIAEAASEEEAIRLFRERVDEINAAKLKAREEQKRQAEAAQTPRQRDGEGEQERKRMRLESYAVPEELPIPTASTAAPTTPTKTSSIRADETGYASPSLSPLRVSVRKTPASTPLAPRSVNVAPEESPNRLLRRFAAASQADRDMAAKEKISIIEPTSDQEDGQRDAELAAVEERMRRRREERQARLGLTPKAKLPARAIVEPPKLSLVDEHGNNETIPQGISRTFSATTMLNPSLTPVRVAASETPLRRVAEQVRKRQQTESPPAVAIATARLPPLPQIRYSPKIGIHHVDAIAEVSREELESPVAEETMPVAPPAEDVASTTPRAELSLPVSERMRSTSPPNSSTDAVAGSQMSQTESTPPPAATLLPSPLNKASRTPPILRPTYATRSPNVIPTRGSGLRNEVVVEDDSTTRSNASVATQQSEPAVQEALSEPLLISEQVEVMASTPIKAVPSSISTPQPPRSILKNSGEATPQSFNRLLLPPRSISFADGKTTGRMVSALDSQAKNAEDSWEDDLPTPKPKSKERSQPAAVLVAQEPISRAAQIQALLAQVAALTMAEEQGAEASVRDDHDEDSWQAPSPSSRYSNRLIRPADRSSRSLASSRASRGPGRSVWNFDETSIGDKTFLTQASFEVAHDRIVEALTDVAPFVDAWDELKTIDLSGRKLESLVRLKEFMPGLEEAHIDDNQISYLTGLPPTLRSLTASHNQLSSVVSFGHLLHLETLDISHNGIEDLSALECLVHLRHLKADHNSIRSIEGIQGLNHLHTVSLRENKLSTLDLLTVSWRRLSVLDVSHNRLSTIKSISNCRHLRSLNLNSNDLTSLDLGPSLPKLKILRVSSNPRLTTLDVLPARELRTLYADFCGLVKIDHLGSLSKLENLSVRQQSVSVDGQGYSWPGSQVQDVKRLYLSGNACPSAFAQIDAIELPRLTALPTVAPLAFTNLLYLEMSACQLSHLPTSFATLFPNLHQLNLDHNLFSKLPRGCFSGMNKLKRVSMVGCRIKKTRVLIEAFQSSEDEMDSGSEALQVLDCRSNPVTLGLYPPIVSTLVPLESSSSRTTNASIVGPAHLAPIPDAQHFRPDVGAMERVAKQAAQKQEVKEEYEQSFWHKKHVAPELVDPNQTIKPSTATSSDKEEAGATSSPFIQSDTRFLLTLPPAFKTKRLLHRGSLGMVCPLLTWLDGVPLKEEEVDEAERWFKREESR